MGRKTQIPQYYAIKDGDAATDITGTKSVVGQTDRALYTCTAVGTGIDGEIDIEISDDEINWFKLPVAPQPVISDADPLAIVQISDITWKFMRPKFRDLSSAAAVGTINIAMSASTQGA